VNLPMPVAVALMLGVGVLLLLGMWRGWRGVQARSADVVGDLPAVPTRDSLGAARTEPVTGTYVSSTTGGDWLDRVAVRDLGHRSPALVQVFDAGVLVERTGAHDLFVPAGAVRGADRVPGMAGKYVGKDGIVVLRWDVADAHGATTRLDTGIRTQHKADRALLVDAMNSLVPQAPADQPHNDKESE